MKPYPSYKDSGVEWIGEIPSHWARKNLKYSFKIQKGKIPKETFDEPNESSLPYLSMDVLRYNTTPHYCDISDGVKVKDKDLLILWDGSKSGEILYGNDGILSSTMSKMDLIDSNLEKPFCYYLLKYYEKDFQYNTVGMGIPHMNGDHLRFSKLILPPLPEQQHIVSFLDHKTQLIDELIEKTEKKIELLKENRTSLINHCVTKGLKPNVEMKDSEVEWIGEIPIGWSMSRLKYFSIITLGKMLTPQDKGGYYLKPYLRGQNIQIDTVDIDDVKEMWFSDDELSKYRLKKGDLLVSEGGDVGRTCMWKNELDECYIQNSVNRVDIINGSKKYYLYHFYLYHQGEYFGSIVNRVSIPHLTKEKLENVVFITLPVTEQQQIVEYLDEQTQKIDATVGKETKRIELLKEYRQSLISEVVTGKIDVREEMVV